MIIHEITPLPLAEMRSIPGLAGFIKDMIDRKTGKNPTVATANGAVTTTPEAIVTSSMPSYVDTATLLNRSLPTISEIGSSIGTGSATN